MTLACVYTSMYGRCCYVWQELEAVGVLGLAHPIFAVGDGVGPSLVGVYAQPSVDFRRVGPEDVVEQRAVRQVDPDGMITG